jgi:hypothetical protein
VRRTRPSWSTAADRRLPVVLAVLAAVLAVAEAADGRWLRAAAWTAGAAFWLWRARRARTPRPPGPAHADVEWARLVLAGAGHPEGVRAVKVLREAEPALSLLDAKQLADRVAG